MIYIKNLNFAREIAQNNFIYKTKKIFNIITQKNIRKTYNINFAIWNR